MNVNVYLSYLYNYYISLTIYGINYICMKKKEVGQEFVSFLSVEYNLVDLIDLYSILIYTSFLLNIQAKFVNLSKNL